MQDVATGLQSNIIEYQAFYISVASCIISLLLLLLTALSVLCAYRAYQHQKQRAYKDAACNLAKFYVQEIIEKYDYVSKAMETSGLAEAVQKKIPYEGLKDFDHWEMTQLVGSSDYSDIEAQMGQMNDAWMAQIKMLLNNLELFSMSCRYGLADEAMLYQPLHGSFLSYMWLFSFYISTKNLRVENKMFTNSIWLFNLWKNRLEEIQTKQKVMQDSAIYKGNPLK